MALVGYERQARDGFATSNQYQRNTLVLTTTMLVSIN